VRATHDEVDLRLRIDRRENAADGVVVLELSAPDGAALPVWEPGAHVDVTLGPLVRQYSLCGGPGRPVAVADRGAA